MNNIEESILESAMKYADSAEVIFEQGEARSVSFENNKLKSVSTKSIRGIGLRVIKNGRIGFSSTTDLRKPEQLVANAIESAKFGQEAKFEFPSQTNHIEVETFDNNVVNYPIEDAIELGRNAIDAALTVNPDYECGVGIGKGIGLRRLINSRGLDISRQSTHFSIGIDILFVKGQGLIWTSEGESSQRLSTNLDKHTQKALECQRLAEKEVQIGTGTYPVIFTPESVDTVLATFEVGCNGKFVQKGASPLVGKIGEKIIDERVSMYDDSTIDYADSSFPFDGEGTPARKTPLIENGVLKNYVYDLQTAGIMNAKSTGNGTRGFASQPAPGCTNIIIEPGDMAFGDMIADMKRGLLVDQVLGGGQSNVLAGEFSVNIDLGFLIENGEIVGRVKDCMIAGNAFDTFNNIIALGNKTEWHGATKLPHFYFQALNVASNSK
ncbi:MAG: TldD/PmbA family protein [Candidatus Brocadiales bacterium]